MQTGQVPAAAKTADPGGTRPAIVLDAALQLLRPLVRLLVRHGVGYPAFAAALKAVFMQAAEDELAREGKKRTDSAVSLLSGVHRRDLRTLARPDTAAQRRHDAPMNMASQVVARWLQECGDSDSEGLPAALTRAEFDHLVSRISTDTRSRAVLDELQRLGLISVSAEADRIELLQPGFAPRQGFAEMAALLRDNLHDHLGAAVSNIDGGGNYLEQAIFVDQLTEASARHLHQTSARAWRTAFRTVMREAQVRFDHDQIHEPAHARVHRARFGAYFYATEEPSPPPHNP